jgi:uncharacterized repeat protein (TIGR03803 family)
VFDFEHTLTGFNMNGSFVQGANGKLYAGITSGGSGNHGVVFEFDIAAHTFKKIEDLHVSSDGEYPIGSISLAPNGKIYAVAPKGGLYNEGVLVECDPSIAPGHFTKKINFQNAVSGANPRHAPVTGPGGKLYGTTINGGTQDAGTIYEYDPSTDAFKTKFQFELKNGAHPEGLLLAKDQKFYGILNFGGYLFQYDAVANTVSNLASLPFTTCSLQSSGHLIQAENGKLYGLVSCNSAGDTTGNLFEYDIALDTLVTKVVFNTYGMGLKPYGTLAEAPNGKLYGVTAEGGLYKQGTLFEYDPASGVHKKLVDFKEKELGWQPNGGLLLASNGKLYGTTAMGGKEEAGVVFEYDYVSGLYTKKSDFTGLNGLSPFGTNLIEVCKSIDIIGSSTGFAVCQKVSATLQTMVTGSFSYQWYKDGKLIPGATSKDYTIISIQPSDDGFYSCELNNGCRAVQTDPYRIIVLPLDDPSCKGNGINEQELHSIISMYPNPANDELHIRIDAPDVHHLSIELVDVLGRFVQQEERTFTDQETFINIRQLRKGTYWVRIRDASNSIFENKKLIKQ